MTQQDADIQERLNLLLDNPFNLILLIDFEGNFLDANTTALNLLGYQKTKLITLKIYDLLFENETAYISQIIQDLEKRRNQQKVAVFKLKKENAAFIDTDTVWQVINQNTNNDVIQIIGRDISTEKRYRDLLEQSERKFLDLVEESTDMIFIDSKDRIVFINKISEQITGYSPNEILAPGFDFNTLLAPESMHNMLDIRQSTIKIQSFTRKEISLIHKNGKRIRLLFKILPISYDGEPAICGIATDVSKLLSAEQDQLDSAAKLIKAIIAIIDVIASTMQLRDPYTSIHQNRVTQLSCEISKILGFSEHRIEGIRLGAMVHDIGKIYIPAEILNKPPPLNEFELSLIKMHARAGYDILKKIEFPWPIPEIALQHHERLDGSGYPGSLIGENIILESRLVAVADVVEAVATHRPYRPAHGIDNALLEVAVNKGKLYDINVVDACLHLFYEKGFTLD